MAIAIGKTTKNHKIEIRVTKHDKDIIYQAAKRNGVKPSVWILSALLSAANQTNSADDI